MLIHNINLRSDSGELLATVSIARHPYSEGPNEDVVGTEKVRAVIEGLRHLPFSRGIVSVFYPQLGRRCIINQPNMEHKEWTSPTSSPSNNSEISLTPSP